MIGMIMVFMQVPEMQRAVRLRIDLLESQLAAAKAFLESLEEEAPPAVARKSKLTPKQHTHTVARTGQTHREFIRTVIRKHEAEGLTPVAIRELAQKAGRSIP